MLYQQTYNSYVPISKEQLHVEGKEKEESVDNAVEVLNLSLKKV